MLLYQGERAAAIIEGFRAMMTEAPDDPEALRVAVGPGPHTRLAELKRRYDPTNLFRHNPNVAPIGIATS